MFSCLRLVIEASVKTKGARNFLVILMTQNISQVEIWLRYRAALLSPAQGTGSRPVPFRRISHL